MRQVCERIREPSRLDADCVSGEGLHFSFPETYCNIFHETENTGIVVKYVKCELLSTLAICVTPCA